MRNIVWAAISVIGISGLVHAASVEAATPTEQLRGSIDQVLKILKDEGLKRPGKDKERRAVIRKVINEQFNFEEMSKRSLATHWAKRTPQEKKEFVEVFTNLLERSYMDRIEAYTDQQVEYNSEKIDEGFAVIRTTITAKDKEPIPIDYKLIKDGANWKVYDVVIEGISLVNNYRNQFNKIISANSYQELLKKMRTKEAEILKEPGAGGKKKSSGGLD